MKNSTKPVLFSLVNPSGLSPTLAFGDGHDLYIPYAPNSNNCSTNLNNTYQCPSGQNAKVFLTGDETFRVSEMEVYRL